MAAAAVASRGAGKEASVKHKSRSMSSASTQINGGDWTRLAQIAYETMTSDTDYPNKSKAFLASVTGGHGPVALAGIDVVASIEINFNANSRAHHMTLNIISENVIPM